MKKKNQEPPIVQDEGAEQTQNPENGSAVRAEVEEKARQRDEFQALAQRAQADLINYRRRIEEEREILLHNASTRVMNRVLPIIDDFQRAIDHLSGDADTSWSDGISMILRKLQGLVESEGITSFSPEPGSSFDPSEHEAIYYQPTDAYSADCVINTVLIGYRNATRVVRHAQVIVSQSPQQDQVSN